MTFMMNNHSLFTNHLFMDINETVTEANDSFTQTNNSRTDVYNETQIRKNTVELVLITQFHFFATYISPMICILGILGNSFLFLSVIIRKLYKRSPVFIFLAYIALVDTGSVLSYNGVDIIGMFGINVTNPIACNVKFVINYSCNYISVYILIAAYVFKLRGVLRPLEFICRDQIRRVVVICGVVTVIAVSLPIGAFVIDAFNVEPLGVVHMEGKTVYIYECIFSHVYPRFKVIYPFLNMVIYTILPGIILLGLSIAIIVVLHRSHNDHLQMSVVHRHSRSVETGVYSSQQSCKQHTEDVNMASASLNEARNTISMITLNNLTSREHLSENDAEMTVMEPKVVCNKIKGSYVVNVEDVIDNISEETNIESVVIDKNTTDSVYHENKFFRNTDVVDFIDNKDEIEDSENEDRSSTKETANYKLNSTDETNPNDDNPTNPNKHNPNDESENKNIPSNMSCNQDKNQQNTQSKPTHNCQNKPAITTNLALTRSLSKKCTPNVYSSAKAVASIFVTMSVLHIVTTLPRFFTAMLYMKGNISDVELLQVVTYFYIFSRIVGALNYTFNVYLQLAFSRFYRRTVAPWIKC